MIAAESDMQGEKPSGVKGLFGGVKKWVKKKM